jgi:hypothetical protein
MTVVNVDSFQAELRQTVDFVFQTMLELEVNPLAVEWRPSLDQITAAIFFTGPWKGAVIIDCRRVLAMEITAS